MLAIHGVAFIEFILCTLTLDCSVCLVKFDLQDISHTDFYTYSCIAGFD